MTLELNRTIFEKYSNIKFHENLSTGSRVVPCGQTDGRTDGRTDITKLRHFAILRTCLKVLKALLL